MFKKTPKESVKSPTLIACLSLGCIYFLVSMAPLRGEPTEAVLSKKHFVSVVFTEPKGFTGGVEGPAVDRDGNVYAVNFAKQGTIGKVTPDGKAEVFVTLPDNSVGNGIRFDRKGTMYIADYVNHNVLKVDMKTKKISVHAHEPKMSQPNDLALGANAVIFCSDPDWGNSTGRIWRVDPDGKVTRLADELGTTNGIEVSPDEKKLYVNESIQRNVWVFDLNDKSELSNKRLLIKFEDFGMDGMRCDVAGNLYITRHGKGTIAIVSPDGSLVREIALKKGKNPSNIAFGGPDGKTCYMTVHDQGNIEAFRTDTAGRAWKLLSR